MPVVRRLFPRIRHAHRGLEVKRPSFQFYPGDWMRDLALRSCSVKARGLWIDMLCLMHEGQPYGHLKVGSKVILPDNLAFMVGLEIEELNTCLSELKNAEVFSEKEGGCMYSRRMVRDEKIRKSRAAGGFKGGNPSLKKDNHKIESKVNLPTNLKPTPSSSSSSASTGGAGPEWADCQKWLADVRNSGADYTEKEARSAFLALDAGGWMWGKNKVADWRSALERQIQTDRGRNQKQSGPVSLNPISLRANGGNL